MTPLLSTIRSENVAPAPARRPMVLLAEPDRLRGALIAAGLEDLGVDVVWVRSGDAAIEEAEQTPFDLHVIEPSLRGVHRERVVEALVTEHPRVPLVLTGSSGAVVHLASTRLPATEVVDLVRAGLTGRSEPGSWGRHPRSQARARR